jgi:hypothetical protein
VPAKDSDIACPDYVEMAVSAIKRTVFESLGDVKYSVQNESIILRPSSSRVSPDSGIIGWRGEFVFQDKEVPK